MRILVFFCACFLISCNEPQKHRGNVSAKDTVIAETTSKPAIIGSSVNKSNEIFAPFFKKFKSDKVFRSTRIISPLYYYQIDDSEINSEKYIKNEIGLNEILLNQSDWKEKIIIREEIISSDTIDVILEGDDTGLRMIHEFIIKNSKWFLSKITDLST